MKKILFILLALTLIACSKVTRTDVVDLLVDNGFTRNKANFYEKYEESYIIRIGYRSTISGYMESLRRYIGPGPIIIIDIDGTTSYNYHINEDAMLYDIKCWKNGETITSEMIYKFNSEQFVVENNYCEYDTKNNETLIEEFKAKKEIVVAQLEKLDLNKKKLNLLGK